MSATPSSVNRGDSRANKYVARSAQIASRVLGGEVIIMSAKDSTIFTLNDVATVIWEAADGATPLARIVSEKICDQFDVPPETALRDAETLVEQLAGHGILILSENPIQPPVAGQPAEEGAR